MIHFDHVTYTYPDASRSALADLTLDIAEGEFALVMGSSGAGKSTLLRCINGLVPHFTGGALGGRITVAGHDPVKEGPQALSRAVGFVFQDPEAQFVLDRVEDEIAFALENAAVPPAEMRMRVEEVLHLLDLASLRDRPLDTLSGGEKQRVAIAAALAFRPQVLVLDEPTSQLDPQSAEDVLSALTRLNVDLGLTVVLAEHRLERVLPHIDRLIYLPNGPSVGPSAGVNGHVLSGPPRQILRQVDLTPPLVTLGKTLGWDPLPLTIKEGRAFTREAPPLAQKTTRQPDSGHSADPLLRVERLSFAYNGAFTLSDVSLSVNEGELVALMGRNGSGKTTLLKCIVGLLRPRQGGITLAGESLIGQETAQICQHVGYLPQEPDDLLFADTVADELAVTLRYHELLDRPPVSPDRLLARLGLDDVAAAYPRDLSVGQRQRVALGAVTVTHPRLLILDEPTRGLDYRAKQALVQLLREWQAEGVGVLLVTHDVELVAQAADRVVILSQGEVIADDEPEVLTASPLFAPQVARLFPGRGWLVVEDALANLDVPPVP
ncbi:MAG TPA: ATP-binding cassette domain-containing protein [Chloroflexi bacterium]|nr:ATP-binding cassette domain-containing protein [Chloroflexota bacterium]